MMHKVIAEVVLLIDDQDQAYAATAAEKGLLAVTGVHKVYIARVIKQATGDEDNNHGITKVEAPVIKTQEVVAPAPLRRDPGISFTMGKAPKKELVEA